MKEKTIKVHEYVIRVEVDERSMRADDYTGRKACTALELAQHLGQQQRRGFGVEAVTVELDGELVYEDRAS